MAPQEAQSQHLPAFLSQPTGATKAIPRAAAPSFPSVTRSVTLHPLVTQPTLT